MRQEERSEGEMDSAGRDLAHPRRGGALPGGPEPPPLCVQRALNCQAAFVSEIHVECTARGQKR